MHDVAEGVRHDRPDAPDAPDASDAPEAGWPRGMPYTVYFPDDDGSQLGAADLEHAAPLPRVGDTVEYLDEAGGRHRYVVREVIHTLQTSAATRPSVREADALSLAVPHPAGQPEPPGGQGALRAGLPKVILARAPATADEG